MTFSQVIPGVFQVVDPGGRVNSFIVTGEETWTVLDAGYERSGDAILAALSAAGEDPTRPGQILVSHAHADHIGGLAELKRKTGARVVAGKAEVSAIRSYIGRPGVVDRTVEDGDSLPGGLRAVATPGHSAGHTSYHFPEMDLLFVGDAIFNQEGLSEPPIHYTGDVEQARESIRLLSRLAFGRACFGHGDPVLEDASTLVRLLAEGF